jgi:hypothetical protein
MNPTSGSSHFENSRGRENTQGRGMKEAAGAPDIVIEVIGSPEVELVFDDDAIADSQLPRECFASAAAIRFIPSPEIERIRPGDTRCAPRRG